MTNKDTFDVCAGWTAGDQVIGTCYIEKARGSEVIAFSYSNTWIEKHPGFFLDPDISPVSGRQYPPQDKLCFGFLSDTAPDRWGRKLMERREALDARNENRKARQLMESDYILGVHDGGRQGGLRFRDAEGRYLADRKELAAPPITELRKLQQAVSQYETIGRSASDGLRILLAPGSSLGGARPKANVVHSDGSMWIAKFPSQNDTINVGAWEMILHDLGEICGLRVPAAQHISLSDQGGIYLSRRFDRFFKDGEHLRVHYASAMSLLGETDRSVARSSYLDILSLIEEHSSGAGEDASELWRRMVFNICTGNTDDHLRNHGFLMVNDAWRLAPAFDVNPEPEKDELSLTIDGYDNGKDIRTALDAAPLFRIHDPVKEAEKIQTAIKRFLPGRADLIYHSARRMISSISLGVTMKGL